MRGPVRQLALVAAALAPLLLGSCASGSAISRQAHEVAALWARLREKDASLLAAHANVRQLFERTELLICEKQGGRQHVDGLRAVLRTMESRVEQLERQSDKLLQAREDSEHHYERLHEAHRMLARLNDAYSQELDALQRAHFVLEEKVRRDEEARSRLLSGGGGLDHDDLELDPQLAMHFSRLNVLREQVLAELERKRQSGGSRPRKFVEGERHEGDVDERFYSLYREDPQGLWRETRGLVGGRFASLFRGGPRWDALDAALFSASCVLFFLTLWCLGAPVRWLARRRRHRELQMLCRRVHELEALEAPRAGPLTPGRAPWSGAVPREMVDESAPGSTEGVGDPEGHLEPEERDAAVPEVEAPLPSTTASASPAAPSSSFPAAAPGGGDWIEDVGEDADVSRVLDQLLPDIESSSAQSGAAKRGGEVFPDEEWMEATALSLRKLTSGNEVPPPREARTATPRFEMPVTSTSERAVFRPEAEPQPETEPGPEAAPQPEAGRRSSGDLRETVLEDTSVETTVCSVLGVGQVPSLEDVASADPLRTPGEEPLVAGHDEPSETELSPTRSIEVPAELDGAALVRPVMDPDGEEVEAAAPDVLADSGDIPPTEVMAPIGDFAGGRDERSTESPVPAFGADAPAPLEESGADLGDGSVDPISTEIQETPDLLSLRASVGAALDRPDVDRLAAEPPPRPAPRVPLLQTSRGRGRSDRSVREGRESGADDAADADGPRRREKTGNTEFLGELEDLVGEVFDSLHDRPPASGPPSPEEGASPRRPEDPSSESEEGAESEAAERDAPRRKKTGNTELLDELKDLVGERFEPRKNSPRRPGGKFPRRQQVRRAGPSGPWARTRIALGGSLHVSSMQLAEHGGGGIGASRRRV